MVLTEDSGSSASADSPAPIMAKIDHLHPYYLHASDSPGMALVFSAFDGTGYGSWRKSILVSLSAKNKLGFIDGTLVKPKENFEFFNLWTRCNDMVFAWLLNSLTKKIRSSVIHSKSAHDLWKQLEKRYGQSNLAQLFDLQKQIMETIQGSNNIATYFNNMKAIWDEIDLLDSRVVCSCVDCKCGAVEKNSALEERQKLVQFLMGLNETYTACRGNIMMMNPSPDIDRAYFLLLQEERQRSIQPMGILPTNSISFSVTRQSSNLGQGNQRFNMQQGSFYSTSKPNSYQDNRRNNLSCKYCKKTGHTIEKCLSFKDIPQIFNREDLRTTNQGRMYNQLFIIQHMAMPSTLSQTLHSLQILMCLLD